ncbi:hypothetical protein [Bacillus nitratireducens]|uniref:hypothetical protein n=1 Tax=Bacillus nitratireducens TaxID=2026193 RepID=UPI000BEE38A0|nr:hypothetical protein [Bacillus nitratireducens]PEE16169.1 hypothetical protein CON53_20945 [Bacillus cereus]MED0904113.1 hypothetical protein [Bacillus nitratireducens]PFH92823.1 hypothetical protein COI81_03810 [Bacillus cereus]PFM47589.1 hypothetical protein COJ52_29210 [Bacillus cereus]PFS18158.1 hypothetical protein COK55_04520 [Bacillus cereus]
MFDKLKRLFKKDKENDLEDERYILISESELNEELKRKIVELERLGSEYSKVLQKKYINEFERKGKRNLKIWVNRDIDGDEIEDLNSEKCLEKEYRSEIIIDFNDVTVEDDEYAEFIQLWYYYGGYFKSTGTLYDTSRNNLETDIETALQTLLE